MIIRECGLSEPDQVKCQVHGQSTLILKNLTTDRNLFVTATKDYIAKTKGTRTFPWRVFVIAQNDVKLIENDLVFRLAEPNKIEDTEWIKPGQVAWDWWNANNIYGVDFVPE